MKNVGMFDRSVTNESGIRRLIWKAMAYHLEGTDIFNNYTIEQMVDIYNGIGPESMNPKIRELITKLNSTPLPAVLIHDLSFEYGGTKEDFHNVNHQLYHNLRNITKRAYSIWNPWRYVQWVRSWYFYKLCEKTGFDSWNLREE